MKKIIVFSLTLVVISLASWYIIRPSYDFHYYRISGCQDDYLTVIIYSKIGERGIIIAKGKHDQVPESDYVINRQLSGFDAYFNFVATCDDRAIIVNFIDGYFDPMHTSSDVITRRVDSNVFDHLRNSNRGKYIELY